MSEGTSWRFRATHHGTESTPEPRPARGQAVALQRLREDQLAQVASTRASSLLPQLVDEVFARAGDNHQLGVDAAFEPMKSRSEQQR